MQESATGVAKSLGLQPEALTTLFEISPAAILVHVQGLVRYVNPACVALFAATDESALLGRPILDLVHSKHHQEIKQRVQESLHSGKAARSMVETLLREDGTHVQAEVTAFPFPFEDGVAMLVMARDLTAGQYAEQKFRELIENLSVGVLVTDPETRILYCNQAATEMLSLRRDEITQRDCFDPNWDVIDASGAPMVATQFPIPMAIRERCPWKGVVMGVARPGLQERVWLLVDAVPVFHEDGEVAQVVCTFADMSERRRAEARQREMDTRFQAVVESLGEAIVITDLEDHVVFANARLLDMTGFSSEDLVGASCTESLFPESEWAIAHERNRRRLQGISEGYETKLVTKTGQEFWAQVSATPFRTPGGEIVGTIGALLDISDRVAAETALVKSEERLKLALDSSKEGIWDWSLSDDRVVTSQGIGRLLEGQTDVNLGRRELFRAVVAEEDLPRVESELRRHIAGQSEGFSVEFRIRTREGLRWVTSRGRAVERDAKGRPLRIIGTLTDIHELKQAEEELIAARDMLEARVRERTLELTAEITQRKLTEERLRVSNQELESFAHSISHDLKAPLRAISGFASALEEDYSEQVGDQGKTYIGIITSSVKRMDEMLDGMLRLARLGRSEAPEDAVDLEVVFQQVKQNLAPLLRDSGAEIQSDKLPVVAGYPSALLQLLQNLVANAVKYRKPGENAHIEVRAKRQNGRFVLSVIDQGIGMSEEDLSRIFEPFERLQRAGSEGGTGLGLTIARKVAQLHGSDLQVESEPGKGARFWLTLEPAASQT